MQTAKEIRENLIDAGCSSSETEAILGCILQGKTKEADKLIGKSRKKPSFIQVIRSSFSTVPIPGHTQSLAELRINQHRKWQIFLGTKT